MADLAQLTLPKPVSDDEVRINGSKVLIADDSVIYRTLVQRTLSKDACSVLVARSGEEAIEIFERERPALVITDWEMPDLTGIELCQKIRSGLRSSSTYIIILTSNAEKENVVKGLSAGADDYLTKPFHSDELLARVRVGRRLMNLHEQIEAKNRLLEEMALTDSLTGLPNRRAIETWAPRQLSGAARHGYPLWVIMADLDHFKNVNDTYGHDAGDIVLRKFADVMKSNSRQSDLFGRVGGEEFLQIVTHVDEESVPVVIERLRSQIAAEPFALGGAIVTVTASFGAAGFCGKKAPEFGELVSQADRALYRAKNQGRNRIEIDPLTRT